jgi:hypothetical protein
MNSVFTRPIRLASSLSYASRLASIISAKLASDRLKNYAVYQKAKEHL